MKTSFFSGLESGAPALPHSHAKPLSELLLEVSSGSSLLSMFRFQAAGMDEQVYFFVKGLAAQPELVVAGGCLFLAGGAAVAVVSCPKPCMHRIIEYR